MKQYKVIDPNGNGTVKCGDIVTAVKTGHNTYIALVKRGWTADKWHQVPKAWMGKQCWSFSTSHLEYNPSINEIYEN